MTAKSIQRSFASTAICAFGALSFAGAALAAESEAAEATAASASGTQLQEVIVTAQRKTQNLQAVPLSVVAIPAVQLQRQNIQTVLQLSYSVPNTIIEQVAEFPGAASLSVRGVGYSGIESFTDADVAVYVNDVYQARNATALSSTLDVSSVEVLRGPQGTLYGRNAYAGAVSVQTNKPEMSRLGGTATVNYGNYNTLDADFIGNVPIIDDKLALRVAFRDHSSDGFWKNNGIVGPNGQVDPTLRGQASSPERSYYIRPSLRWTPNDRWDATLFSEIFIERDTATPQTHQFLPVSPLSGQGFPGTNPFGDQSRNIPGDGSNPYSTGNDVQGKPVNFDVYSVTANIAYRSDFGLFKGIFNVNGSTSNVWVDTVGENVNIFASDRFEDYGGYSAELQYIATLWNRLDITAGVLYLADHYHTTQLSFTDFVPPFAGIFNIPAFPYPATEPSANGATYTYINNTGKRNSTAGYAQFEYHFTNRLSLVAGGRYTTETKDGYMGENSALTAALFPTAVNFAAHPFTSALPNLVFHAAPVTFNNFAPRVGVNYKYSDDILLFAFWQRAYKSGGFNANSSDPTAFETPYGTEKVDNYEGGWKTQWFDRRLRFNANIFYANYDNLQRSLVTPTPTASSGVTTVTTNAANETSYGIELELAGKPTDSLTLYANAGYDRAYYTSYCAALQGATPTPAVPPGKTECAPATQVVGTSGVVTYLVPVNNAQFVPARAPKWQFSIGATQDFDLGQYGSLSANAQVNYTGAQYLIITNNPYSFRPAMAMLDANVRYEPRNSRYSVTVWGRNLTNNIQLDSFLTVGTEFTSYGVTAPRTFGVSVAAKF